MKKIRIKWWHIALILCLALVFFSPLASSSPDGLEKVAEDKGFIEEAHEAPFQVIADYMFPGIENEAVATILAGLIGTAGIFVITYGAARLIRFGKNKKATAAER
ncbi:MAG: PDGLE domain-containing protein [Dehalococcoidia bacterium]